MEVIEWWHILVAALYITGLWYATEIMIRYTRENDRDRHPVVRLVMVIIALVWPVVFVIAVVRHLSRRSQ